jgi:hypothetical protein
MSRRSAYLWNKLDYPKKIIDEEFEEIIRIGKLKKNRQHNGQKDKQRSTKHYTEN